MWLLLRLVIAAIAGYVRSTSGPWRVGGERIPVDDLVMRLVRDRSKSAVTRVTLIVDVPWAMDVVFRREADWDRTLRRFGLVHEHQHGDPGFDSRVFVECDDEGLARALLAAQGASAAILGCLSGGADRVFCARGQLGVSWPGHADGDVYRDHLETLAKAWSSVPEAAAGRADPFAWRALLASCLLWSLVTWTIVAVFELGLTNFPRVVSKWSCLEAGLLATLPTYALLAILARLLLGRSSHGAKVLLEVLVTGLFLSPILALVSVHDADIDLDRTAPGIVEATVLDTRHTTTHSSKGGTTHHYYVLLWDLRAKASAPPAVDPAELSTEYEVGYGIYSAVRRDMEVQLVIRRGALGLPWIEELRLPAER
jgi:hypothetical protein